MQGWYSNCICQQGLINNLSARVDILIYYLSARVEMLSNRIDQQGLIYWCIICQQGLICWAIVLIRKGWYVKQSYRSARVDILIYYLSARVEMLSNRIDQQGLIYWCIICQQGLICWAIVSISKGWGSKKSGILSPLNWSKPPGKKQLHNHC